MAFEQGVYGRAYLNKTAAELEVLTSEGVLMSGNAFSPVAFVKGEPGPAEQDGGEVLSGDDGKALRASLLALGYTPEEWVALATWKADGTPLESSVLRRSVAVLDPATLVVCDEAAVAVVREAYANELFELEHVEEAMLSPGYVVLVLGMRVLNLSGFEAALGSTHSKQLMWAWLKQIPPLREPY